MSRNADIAEYEIVHGTIDHVNKQVNRMLRRGWVIWGSPTVSIPMDEENYVPSVVQTMIYREEL